MINCEQVTANARFELKMLDPGYWKISVSKPQIDVAISTNDWLMIQQEALSLLNDEKIRTVSPSTAIDFWVSLVRGEPPYGLRIVAPDPMTNIR